MDLSVLPNNNHPEKFLQLDVNSLPATNGIFQLGFTAGAALSGQRQWQNRVYSQRAQRSSNDVRSFPGGSPVLDKAMGKHITTVTLKSKIRRNPLFSDITTIDSWGKNSTPSWTIQEYDRHVEHSNLEDYLRVEYREDPKDLNYWLEDLYTPGYDSLLKKKEAEQKRNKVCKAVILVILSVFVVVVIISVPIVVTNYMG